MLDLTRGRADELGRRPAGTSDGAAGETYLPEAYRRHLIGFLENLETAMHEIERVADGSGLCNAPSHELPPHVTRTVLLRLAGARALVAELMDHLGIERRPRSQLHYLQAVLAVTVEETEASLPSRNVHAVEVDPNLAAPLEITLREIRDLLGGLGVLLRR
jgi:hypothetical protein